jgi:hypothetical protein
MNKRSCLMTEKREKFWTCKVCGDSNLVGEPFCDGCGELRPGLAWDDADVNSVGHIEGWTVSSTDQPETPYQLQKLDIREVFVTDNDAWTHVYRLAKAGSFVHRQALSFLRKTSPKEYAAIREFCEALPPWPYKRCGESRKREGKNGK